jgi:protein translocase SEC61 complex gamma subunit
MTNFFQNAIIKTKSFIIECTRVFKSTKKPNKHEFSVIVKVAGIGILLIGAIGFLVQLLVIPIFS